MGLFSDNLQYGNLQDDPNIKGGRGNLATDALASDIGSIANQFGKMRLGALDARYSPFSGNKVQQSMFTPTTTLIDSMRNRQAGLDKQTELDRASKAAKAKGFDQELVDSFRNVLNQSAQLGQRSGGSGLWR
jgi:hypothetical protein